MSPLSSNSKNVLVEAGQGLTAVEALIVESISSGESMHLAAADSGISRATLYRWRRQKPAFDESVSRALRRRQQYSVDLMDYIARTEPDIQRAKLLCDNIKWQASKYDPKTFGDKLEVQSTVTIQLGSALAEARARVLRPMCDPEPAIDGEFVALPHIVEARAPDCVSEEVALSFTPDIFS
jgi:hypothetical protein